MGLLIAKAAIGPDTVGIVTRPGKGRHRMASKMRVDGLVRLASDNIIVNAVHPGLIYTERASGVANEQKAIRCLGMPADVARLVAFLEGDDAHFMTGQTLIVDGGRIRPAPQRTPRLPTP